MNDDGKITLANSIPQPPSRPRFSLGRLVATPGALIALEQNRLLPGPFIIRHQNGDWGVVNSHDRPANERAIQEGSRILSAYVLDDGTRVWLLTEAAGDDGQRASTCILLPEEY